MDNNLINTIGIIAGSLLPLLNIPLILRIRKTKSSKDISLIWMSGVLLGFACMTPSAIISNNVVFKINTIFSTILFFVVSFYVIKYRKPTK